MARPRAIGKRADLDGIPVRSAQRDEASRPRHAMKFPQRLQRFAQVFDKIEREDDVEGAIRERHFVSGARHEFEVHDFAAFDETTSLVKLRGRDVKRSHLAWKDCVSNVRTDRGRAATCIEDVEPGLQQRDEEKPVAFEVSRGHEAKRVCRVPGRVVFFQRSGIHGWFDLNPRSDHSRERFPRPLAGRGTLVDDSGQLSKVTTAPEAYGPGNYDYLCNES